MVYNTPAGLSRQQVTGPTGDRSVMGARDEPNGRWVEGK